MQNLKKHIASLSTRKKQNIAAFTAAHVLVPSALSAYFIRAMVDHKRGLPITFYKNFAIALLIASCISMVVCLISIVMAIKTKPVSLYSSIQGNKGENFNWKYTAFAAAALGFISVNLGFSLSGKQWAQEKLFNASVAGLVFLTLFAIWAFFTVLGLSVGKGATTKAETPEIPEPRGEDDYTNGPLLTPKKRPVPPPIPPRSGALPDGSPRVQTLGRKGLYNIEFDPSGEVIMAGDIFSIKAPSADKSLENRNFEVCALGSEFALKDLGVPDQDSGDALYVLDFYLTDKVQDKCLNNPHLIHRQTTLGIGYVFQNQGNPAQGICVTCEGFKFFDVGGRFVDKIPPSREELFGRLRDLANEYANLERKQPKSPIPPRLDALPNSSFEPRITTKVDPTGEVITVGNTFSINVRLASKDLEKRNFEVCRIGSQIRLKDLSAPDQNYTPSSCYYYALTIDPTDRVENKHSDGDQYTLGIGYVFQNQGNPAQGICVTREGFKFFDVRGRFVETASPTKEDYFKELRNEAKEYGAPPPTTLPTSFSNPAFNRGYSRMNFPMLNNR